MKYKITIITPPFPTARIPKQTFKQFEDIALFARSRVTAYSDDGPVPFVCPLKGYEKGHRFTVICDHISEAGLGKIMKIFNKNYLVASAVRISDR